jgi:hypothetical protein
MHTKHIHSRLHWHCQHHFQMPHHFHFFIPYT